MTGFSVFARKEASEILRTWRLWVLPGILAFFALTGPPLARYTPQIVQAVAGNQLAGFTVPEPTYLDSYAQWAKNLTQIALLALVIIYGGLVSAESRSGTAVLVLTKPVSRSAFVLGKALVNAGFVAVLLVGGTLMTWGLTAAFFGTAPGSGLWGSALVWLVLAVQFIALMTLLSVLIGSAAGAAGAGLGVYVLLSIASIWKPLARYSPAGLPTQATALAAGTEASALWPVVTSLVLSVLLVAAAALVFRRKEL
ncbi:ABC transporter permease subunit [Cellulomonas sp. NTE-D12]|uniref:ABC transporter permease n=1 Tax=Cellulomonas sp. NTE-D12 TaxID=2962632 RepID=UPI0030814FF6|nr:membrane protein [Cellulomonas sp. NTE-D12]